MRVSSFQKKFNPMPLTVKIIHEIGEEGFVVRMKELYAATSRRE